MLAVSTHSASTARQDSKTSPRSAVWLSSLANAVAALSQASSITVLCSRLRRRNSVQALNTFKTRRSTCHRSASRGPSASRRSSPSISSLEENHGRGSKILPSISVTSGSRGAPSCTTRPTVCDTSSAEDHSREYSCCAAISPAASGIPLGRATGAPSATFPTRSAMSRNMVCCAAAKPSAPRPHIAASPCMYSNGLVGMVVTAPPPAAPPCRRADGRIRG